MVSIPEISLVAKNNMTNKNDIVFSQRPYNSIRQANLQPNKLKACMLNSYLFRKGNWWLGDCICVQVY